MYNQRKKIPLQFPLSDELFERAKKELEIMDNKKSREIQSPKKITSLKQFSFTHKNSDKHFIVAPDLKALLHRRLN